MAVCTACNSMEVADDQMEAHMASEEHMANAANAETPAAEAPAEGGDMGGDAMEAPAEAAPAEGGEEAAE